MAIRPTNHPTNSRTNRQAHPRYAPIEQPILAFIDCDITGGGEELAREQLVQRGMDYQSHGVAPLFVTWLRERANLRMVCMVRNLGEFNDFMLDEVRGVEGIRETRTTLSFGGWAEVDTLLELEMEVSPSSTPAVTGFARAVAASVWINVQPGMDRECFSTLRTLPPHPDVRQVWLLHCYQSHESDLSLLLLGKNPATLSAYVMSWIRTAPGVLHTEIGTVEDWRWLAEADDLVELCGLFFQFNQHGAAGEADEDATVEGSASADIHMPQDSHIRQH
jgi:hypothetical protein